MTDRKKQRRYHNRHKKKKYDKKYDMRLKPWIIVLLTLAVMIILVVVIFKLSQKEVNSNSDEQRLEDNIAALQEEFGGEADITVEEGEPPADPKSSEADVTAISGYVQKAGADTENGNVAGMTFPFQVPDSSLQILSVGQYTGPYVEGGEDIPVSNVMSLVVKNTGNQMVEYAEIELSADEDETVCFTISALPAGTSVMVQEAQQAEYSPDAVYTYSGATEALVADEKSMQEDKLQISGEDGKITVKNLTDSDMDRVYVCYRTISNGGVYLGGIAYRVPVEDLKAGEEKSIESGHYLQGYSSILFAEIVSEEAY